MRYVGTVDLAAADRLTESAVDGDGQGAEPPRYAVAEVEDADAAEWPHNTTAGLSLARLNALEALASG